MKPLLIFALLTVSSAPAQVSLTTAVSLALGNSPKVKIAADDLAKSRATVDESVAVFIPAISIGAGLGNNYGYSPYPPTLFALSAQSLLYGSSQFDYIRSARSGLQAAQFSLDEARAAVSEDAVTTYIALDHDQQREAVLHDQLTFATRLATISQDRFDAGRDTNLDLTTARLTAAQFREAVLHAEDETANNRNHLSNLIGITAGIVKTEGPFPPLPSLDLDAPPTTQSPAIAAAYASAKAKQEQAWGDARYLYRPQFSFLAQYQNYATYSSSFQDIQTSYEKSSPNGKSIGPNAEAFAVQVTLPLFDKVRQAKARESAADAAHALHEADSARLTFTEGQSKLARSIIELRAHAETATLQQQLAQQQLDALLVELNAPPVDNRPQLTPKDEQNARIAEREKYLAFLDATFQLRQAQISLMRQTGQLIPWLRTVATPTFVPIPSNK